MKIGRLSNLSLAVVVAFSFVALAALRSTSRPYGFGPASLADLSGFLALAFIAATGVIMLFKAPLSTAFGSPESLWRLHVLAAGAGGMFMGLHVVLFLAFPISLPVFLGYAATGAALFIWITGGVYFQGVRNSMFYHGVLSTVAIFLMVVHTFGAGRNIPVEASGVALALAAVAVLAGVGLKLFKFWKADSAPG